MAAARRKPPSAVPPARPITTYYALFHCLAGECANLFIGPTTTDRSAPAWRQVYRALEHGFAKNKCSNTRVLSKFPSGIFDFANSFVSFQEQRHLADYDPAFTVDIIKVAADIDEAADSIDKFRACDAKDRRAFCAYVLLKDPRS